ncbi:MAG: ferredoxin [Patescibacteria group bacterium]|jgi:ferredoxin
MSNIKKITVNRDLCIGAASCILAANTVFEFDAENKATIILGDGTKAAVTEKSKLKDPSVTDDTLIKAARSCPTKAIILEDETGNQVYP